MYKTYLTTTALMLIGALLGGCSSIGLSLGSSFGSTKKEAKMSAETYQRQAGYRQAWKTNFHDKLALAGKAEEQKKWDEAERHYIEIEKWIPNDTIGLLCHARMLESAKRPAEAVVMYQKALTVMRKERNQMSLPTLCRYIYLLDKQGDKAEADREMNEAVPRILAEQIFCFPQYRLVSNDYNERYALVLLKLAVMEPGKDNHEMDWAYSEIVRLAPRTPTILFICATQMLGFDRAKAESTFRQAQNCSNESEIQWLRENIYNHMGKTYEQMFGK